jgi:type IV secretory pathway TrbD component
MKVYLALTRPKLKRGAEWKLTFFNAMLTILMVILGLWHWTWWAFLAAGFFYWPGQWLLQQAAKHDPNWLAVYSRSLAHSPIREPHGFGWVRDSRWNRLRRVGAPRRILPQPSRWVK